MLNRFLKLNLAGIALLGLFILPVLTVQPAYAQVDEATKTAACDGIGAVGVSCDSTRANTSIDRIIKTAVEVLSWVVGVTAVIMVIIGGFRYVTSGGDSNATASAKNTILYALIGFVIALVAQVLVRFVFNRATTSGANESVNACIVDEYGRFVRNPDPSRACAM